MKKIYNLNTILVFILTPLLFIISCHKQNDSTGAATTDDHFSLLGTIEKYYKVSNTKVDGNFMFESNLCNNDPALTDIAIAGGVFYDPKGKVQIGDGQISIGTNQYNQNREGTYGFDRALPQNGLFGTDVTFKITPPSALSTNQTRSTSSAQTLTTTLYSPSAISITNVPPRTPITLVPFQNTLLQWNADPSNPNGVVVFAEFLPARYINKTTLSQGFSHLIENSMLVTDNGSTSIPWSFFSIYPAGGHVILWVARGNYTIASNGTYNYQVGGYTAAAIWDVKIPMTPANINCSSYINAPYKIQFTNNVTHLVYTEYLNPNSSGFIQVPVGTYDVGFYPNSGVTVFTTFYINGQSASGYGTTFHGIQMLSGGGPYARIGN